MFYRCSGVGRVLENLLLEFIDLEEMEEIHTILPASLRDLFLGQFPSPKVKPFFVPYGPMGYGDLIRKGRILRSLAGKVAPFFFPGHNVPLSVPGRYIVSVNDITVFSPHFEAPWYRKAGFRLLLSRAVGGADKVVTISETVKQDLVREFSLRPENVVVIYPWIKETFFRPALGAVSEPVFPVEGDYLLYLGLRIAHKNLDGLIRAFLLLGEEFPDLKLVIAGTRYSTPDMVDRWKEDPRLMGKLVEIPDPSDEEIVGLLSGAKAFVFPSFAEGFGLPPLEAMASGVPVVCSDIPVFREVYGDAVRYVDPWQPESIAEGIREVLSDQSIWNLLVDRGKRRADLYHRDRGIRAYIDCLR
jgi:glycosyltransferase involved in cell wall biosynthesis